MKKLPVKSLGVVMAAVLALAGVSIAMTFGRAPRVHVTTAAISEGAIARRVIAVGTVQPTATVQVGAQVSGTIQSIDADFNAIVHAGQVLARIDPAILDAEALAAQAALGEAQAAHAKAIASRSGFAAAADDARAKLMRAEALFVEQLIPQSDLDDARTAMNAAAADLHSAHSDVTAAAASVEQAKAALDQAKLNVSRTVITSPIDGIVVARLVDVGQTVAASFQTPVLFQIASDLTKVQVETEIDESDIAGVEMGEPAAFEVQSYPDVVFEGTVATVRVEPITAPDTNAITYTVVVEVANADEKLRPGMTATVALDGSRLDHAVRVPNAALSFQPPADVLRFLRQPTGAPADPALGRVWLFDGERFTPVNLRTGLSDREWTEVIGGSVRPGDVVVTGASLGRT